MYYPKIQQLFIEKKGLKRITEIKNTLVVSNKTQLFNQHSDTQQDNKRDEQQPTKQFTSKRMPCCTDEEHVSQESERRIARYPTTLSEPLGCDVVELIMSTKGKEKRASFTQV